MPTNYISKVTLPDNTEYAIKDAEARELISQLGTPLEFLGVSIGAITDNANTPYQYQGITQTPPAGHQSTDVIDNGTVVIYGNNEFVWVKNEGATSSPYGTWHAFGNAYSTTNVIGANATMTGSTTTTLGGTSNTTYFVNSDSFDMSTGALPGADYDDYIGPLPKATKKTVVTGVASGGTATALTDLGVTSTQPSSGGTEFITSATLTTNGAISALASTPPSDTFVKSYTPTSQWLTVASRKMLKASPTTSSITPFGSGGSAASWSATVTNENLSFSWTPNTVATGGTAVSVYASGQYDSGTTTFATGAMQASSSGAGSGNFITALNTPTTASALTGLGTPTKTNVVTAVTSNWMKPTTATVIKNNGLATGDSITEADDTYLYWTKDLGLNNATTASSTTTVTWNSKDQKTVLTSAT